MINIDSRLLKELPEKELKLLQVLASYSNEAMTCWPSMKTLAADCKWSEDKVNRVKNSLLEKGLIDSKPRHKPNSPAQTSNLYTIKVTGVYNFIPPANLQGGGVQLSGGVGGNGAGGPGGKIEGEPPALVSEEVLEDEELTIEELKKEKRYISHSVHSIFESLVCCIFTDWSDYRHTMIGYDDYEAEELQEITDPTIRKTVEKLGAAARKIYSAFDSLKRPLPEWRDTSGMFGTSAGEVNALTEAKDQIRAYADYCRMAKQYIITDPDKAPEKLVAADWCKKLLDHVKPLIEKEVYDPAYEEDEIHSGWLLEMYYYQPIGINVCKRYNNRIVWGGEEYLKVKQK